MLGGTPDVAALRVEDHRHFGVLLMDVRDELFQLIFRAAGREVGDLRLERADEVGGRVDDLAAEGENRVGAVGKLRGEARGVGVETDAEQRVGALPAGFEHLGERHQRGPFSAWAALRAAGFLKRRSS